jgi:hypothetical protein
VDRSIVLSSLHRLVAVIHRFVWRPLVQQQNAIIQTKESGQNHVQRRMQRRHTVQVVSRRALLEDTVQGMSRRVLLEDLPRRALLEDSKKRPMSQSLYIDKFH